MSGISHRSILAPMAFAIVGLAASPSYAVVDVQCPGDTDDDAVVDVVAGNENVVCRHLVGSDGFINLADERPEGPLYIFGFSDATGTPLADVMGNGELAANFAAPTLSMDEGDQFYLTLSVTHMAIRPDLFDSHTVHYHGFPQASPIFDGMPEASIAPNSKSSQTYFYNLVDPGTFMYHCHFEATEHMQMGMLGNLYVRPAQNRLPNGTLLGSHIHNNPDNLGATPRHLDNPLDGDKYVYNDGDGSTLYDVEKEIQIGSLDSEFHDASYTVQPLPFAAMKDRYPMLNGRGYPDTINPGLLGTSVENYDRPSQKLSSLIEADAGQKILLRISNLNVTNFYTLSSPSIPMRVVGRGAKILRGGGETTGEDLYYDTTSVTLGGGEARDVILDTTGVTPGTYLLYTSNFNFLVNNTQPLGGMMTEIVIN